MKKAKTPAEIAASAYINKTEFGIISEYTGRHLDRAYEIAKKKDQEDLKDRLIYTAGEKIRITSACWVMGINLNQLQKLKNADALPKQPAHMKV